jgi:hypothetical protein
MQNADRTNNAIVRILNLDITMAVAAEPVGVGADEFDGLLGAAAVGVGVTAAKATVDVFVGQYDAYDEALRAKSHQESEFSAFNTVLSTCGTGSIGGSGCIVISGGINNGGKDSGDIGGIKGVDGSACGGGHPVTAFAHAAASEFH